MIDKVDLIIQQNPDVWKTRSAFFSFVKGVIRAGWKRHPVKIKLINRLRKQIPNPNPKGKKPTVWGATCDICGKDFPVANMEVDHRQEDTAKLTSLSDIQSCVEMLLCVVEDDLRYICKACHAAHSYAQKMGIPFEEAVIEKKIIALMKDRKKCLVMLEEHGYDTKTLKNETKRREALRQIFKGEQI